MSNGFSMLSQVSTRGGEMKTQRLTVDRGIDIGMRTLPTIYVEKKQHGDSALLGDKAGR